MGDGLSLKSSVSVVAKSFGPLPPELKSIFMPILRLDESKIQAFVHGSWADNTRTAFSDIDDLIIIDDDYLNSAKHVLDEIEINFQKIDPLQHHGHWIVLKNSLSDYDGSYMPLHIMSDAIPIFGSSKIEAVINEEVTLEGNISRVKTTCKNLQCFFDEFNDDSLNIYNLKRFVGSIALLPPLLFQIRGIKMNKRDAINRAAKIYSKQSLELLRWASELRQNWGMLMENDDYANLFEKVKLSQNANEWRILCLSESPVLSVKKLSSIQINEGHINNIIKDAIKIIDSVKLLYKSEKDYKQGYKIIEKIAIKNKAILVGRFGNIKYPGVSDLDVFICFEDKDYKYGCELIENLIQKDKQLKYLFTHTPLYCSRSSLSYIPLLHTMYDLQLTWNPERHSIKKSISKDYSDFLSLSWSWILYRTSFHYTFKEVRLTDIRTLLLLLKNLYTAIDNIERMCNISSSNRLGMSGKIRTNLIEGSISNEDVRNFVNKAILDIQRLVSQISSNMKPKSKFIFSWTDHIITPAVEWNETKKYGVVYESVPVFFFNFLHCIAGTRNSSAQLFLDAIIQIRKSHNKTQGYYNRYIVSGIPTGFYEKTKSERKKEERKYLIKGFIKNVVFSNFCNEDNARHLLSQSKRLLRKFYSGA